MNDEGVGRQSGRSRQVGSRHRRPLACHLVGNCTQLTTKSQPTNLRHSGIPSPKFHHESRAGRFLGSNKSISWHQPCGQWVCRRRAELRQTFLCQGSRHGCVYHRAHASLRICSCTASFWTRVHILYVHNLHVHIPIQLMPNLV